jgi:methyl-accepting chemotaxis protein
MSKIKGHLRKALVLEPAKLPDHYSCRFGKWYHSLGKEQYSGSECFRSIDPPHARLHAVAREIVSLANGGEDRRAHELYDEADRLSQTILENLDRLKSQYHS